MELTRRQAGFTLAEALVAAAILLLVAIGLIPMFTQAILNNRQGADSSIVTTYSKTNVEALLPVPFDAAAVTVLPGTTALTTTDWYVQNTASQIGGTSGQWVVSATQPAAGPGQQVLWQRITTVQQYNVNDLTFATPLDGATQSDFVHLKQITVTVQRPPAAGATGLAAGKTIMLRTVRAE